MENLKQEAIRVISALPEHATIEEIMYEMYVLGKKSIPLVSAPHNQRKHHQSLNRHQHRRPTGR